ncbi:MAG: type II secretion system protein [Planctomycetota bacterium]
MPKRRRESGGGYTLIEMIAVISILSILGLLAGFTLVEGMRVYAHIAPTLDARYQAQLAAQRFQRDVRRLDPATVTVLSPTALAFETLAGEAVRYDVAGRELRRNGDALALDVARVSFDYLRSDGSAAGAVSELHLVELDLTIQVADRAHSVRATAFPRVLGP